jgi:hypothetical protein
MRRSVPLLAIALLHYSACGGDSSGEPKGVPTSVPELCGDGSDNVPYCDVGKCAFYLLPTGQLSNNQVPRDCLARTCKFNGNVELVADDADLPVDDNPCTLDLCTNGLPSNPKAPAGTPCGSGKSCDGNGACV